MVLVFTLLRNRCARVSANHVDSLSFFPYIICLINFHFFNCSWIDAAKFLTGASAVGSIAIPIILRHADLIGNGAMWIEFFSFLVFVCTVMCFHHANLEDEWWTSILHWRYSRASVVLLIIWASFSRLLIKIMSCIQGKGKKMENLPLCNSGICFCASSENRSDKLMYYSTVLGLLTVMGWSLRLEILFNILRRETLEERYFSFSFKPRFIGSNEKEICLYSEVLLYYVVLI